MARKATTARPADDVAHPDVGDDTANLHPPRHAGWEMAFVDAVAAHQAAPFGFGTSDCLTLVADVDLAMTGHDPLAGRRGSYDSAAGAAALLAEMGFADVGAALAATYPEVAPAEARRGDAGVVDSDGTLAAVVVMGDRVMGKAPGTSNGAGVTFWPRSALLRAFRVGW